MVSLHELVAMQRLTEESDIQLIKRYFTENDMEEEGIQLITDLTKSQVSKLKNKHHYIEEWGTMLPSAYLYKTYDLDTANNLHMLELNFLINGGSLSPGWLIWAQENVPTIKRPDAYFNPLVSWLKKQGVEFKNK